MAKPRWFRFSLRTTFVLVTIFGVWLGWNLKIVRERKAVVAEINRVVTYRDDLAIPIETKGFPFVTDGRGGHVINLPTNMSPTRRMLGDVPCPVLYMSSTHDPEWFSRAEAAFPEAVLVVVGPDKLVAFRDSLVRVTSKRQPNRGTIFKTGQIEK